MKRFQSNFDCVFHGRFTSLRSSSSCQARQGRRLQIDAYGLYDPDPLWLR